MRFVGAGQACPENLRGRALTVIPVRSRPSLPSFFVPYVINQFYQTNPSHKFITHCQSIRTANHVSDFLTKTNPNSGKSNRVKPKNEINLDPLAMTIAAAIHLVPKSLTQYVTRFAQRNRSSPRSRLHQEQSSPINRSRERKSNPLPLQKPSNHWENPQKLPGKTPEKVHFSCKKPPTSPTTRSLPREAFWAKWGPYSVRTAKNKNDFKLKPCPRTDVI
jgi:hypothetical protein